MEIRNKADATLLHQTQLEISTRLLPVIILTAFLGAVGIIGNVLAMMFYATKCKQTTTVTLIKYLTVVDMIVCFLIIPKVLEMIVNIEYKVSYLCKLTQFLSLWTIVCSCFILWVISIDRHRKICKPFAKQITLPIVKYIVGAIVMTSFVLSVRNLVIYDTIPVNITISSDNRTVTGRYCTVTDNQDYGDIVFIFYTSDFLLVLTIWVTIIITYSHAIFVILRRQMKLRRKHETGNANSMYPKKSHQRGEDTFEKSECSSCNESHEDTVETSFVNDGEHTELPASQRPLFMIEPKTGHFPIDSLQRRVKRWRKKKSRRVTFAGIKNPLERNLTAMMCTASIIFILCFTPFFVVRVLMRTVLGSGIEFELRIGCQFLLKLPFLNSVFNPIIYCILNPKFRKYLNNVIRC